MCKFKAIHTSENYGLAWLEVEAKFLLNKMKEKIAQSSLAFGSL